MPLGQRAGDSGESRYAGAEVCFNEDIQETLNHNLDGGFDFVVTPLTDPSYRPSLQKVGKFGGAPSPPFCGSDLVVPPSQWGSHVVGKVSEWLNLDSKNLTLQSDSEKTLLQELSWASHLSLQACVLPTPPDPLQSSNYARCVNQRLQSSRHMQLWLRIPLVSPLLEGQAPEITEDDVYLQRDKGGRLAHDPWEWWNSFRQLCEHHSQLAVALDITSTLPSPNALKRWKGEPVKAAILHTSSFLTNAKGFPCLSKRHQGLLAHLLNHSVQIVLSGSALHQAQALLPALSAPGGVSGESNGSSSSSSSAQAEAPGKHHLRPYLEYLAHLYRKLEPLSEQDKFEMGYRDVLQAPLQPLMDNLEAQTYETFEKDAQKYTQYQLAVQQALLDKVPPSKAQSTTVILMVVGAGRGPLVRASLKAAKEVSRKLRVYAVEKNPNAVVTLNSLVALEGWQDDVSIISCDMRQWDPPEKADILVSELLGSFGDNELSPECLDGAQKLLKPDGVSIPSQYTSFIAPVTASKLHNEVKAYGELSHFETAFVVKLHKVASLAEPQAVFTFSHPSSPPKDNQRYKSLTFEIPPDTGSSMVHGFAGYFDSVLYGDVHLGIEPSTSTPNMFSWFPIFFPLRQPVYVPSGSSIEVQFWRCVGPTKVWYEWTVSSPVSTPIHNPNGRSYWVGL